MAFDGIITRAMARELDELLALGKIEKIYQPEPDELIFHIHTNHGKYKLLASCSSNHARVHLVDDVPDNPQAPPKFCMLLRKHLQSGRITEIKQVGCERIIEMHLETMDDMGFSVNRKLIFEIMGKHSNIVLVDTNSGKIMDSIKHVSLDVNRVRQLLPGKIYEYPPAQDKIPFDKVSTDDIQKMILSDNSSCISPDISSDITPENPGGNLSENFSENGAENRSEISYINYSPEVISKKLLNGIGGISPAIAVMLAESDNIALTLDTLCMKINIGDFTPSVYLKSDKTPLDFHAVSLPQYEDACEVIYFNELSKAVNYYYVHRDSSNRVRQKANDLERALKSRLSKLQLKKKRLSEDLLSAENSEKYRLYGELITANIHLMKNGDRQVEVINYYDGKPVIIPLDERFSPAKNAQRYFKKYSKSKTAIKEKQIQLTENEKDLDYILSTLSFVENAETVQEIDNIRNELVESGILRKRKSRYPQKKTRIQFLQFETSDGFIVFIGRNNKENDLLTLKKAGSKDWWFHTKDIPGSHVILFSEGKELTETAVMEAAGAAAYYSKGRNSENVPVDYTLVKHVKKPSGAKPGMVIFTDNKTVYVTPSLPENCHVGNG